MVTRGVSDIQVARDFYEALGWRASSASLGDIVFFTAGGVVLALYPRDSLANDASVASTGQGFRCFSLAYNVRQKKDVASALSIAEAAGGSAYSGDGDRRFRFIVTGLARSEVLGVDDNSVGHDG